MKTKLFLFAAAALVAASCTFDETTEVNLGQQIEFRGAMDTRADVDATSLQTSGFYVTAFTHGATGTDTYFDEVQFNYDAGTYSSTASYYWPKEGSLDFYAYTPELSDVTINPTTQKFDYTVAANNAGVDIVTAVATNKNVGPVGLEFKHALSKIIVTAKSSATIHTFKVSGVQLCKLGSTGTYTFSTNTWGPVNSPEDYSATITKTPLTTGPTTLAEGFYLIPQTFEGWDNDNDADNSDEGVYFVVTVEILNGETVVHSGDVAVPVSGTFEPGIQYTYTLNFTDTGAGYYLPSAEDNAGDAVLGAPISFTVTSVADWATDAQSVEKNMQ